MVYNAWRVQGDFWRLNTFRPEHEISERENVARDGLSQIVILAC
jgi:hypothetical protein